MNPLMLSIRRPLRAGIAASFLLLAPFAGAHAMSNEDHKMADHKTLDESILTALRNCQQRYPSCAAATKDSAAILVFPSVIKADLIVGGAGGKGALLENGKITGYYNIGAASAGLQAGIENTSHVYVFNTAESVRELKQGQDWKMGGTAGATLMTENAHKRGSTGNVSAFIFNAKGLQAGISLDVFSVWKADAPRPKAMPSRS